MYSSINKTSGDNRDPTLSLQRLGPPDIMRSNSCMVLQTKTEGVTPGSRERQKTRSKSQIDTKLQESDLIVNEFSAESVSSENFPMATLLVDVVVDIAKTNTSIGDASTEVIWSDDPSGTKSQDDTNEPSGRVSQSIGDTVISMNDVIDGKEQEITVNLEDFDICMQGTSCQFPVSPKCNSSVECDNISLPDVKQSSTGDNLLSERKPSNRSSMGNCKQRKKGRPQRSGKKWKQVPVDIELRFQTSLFPRNAKNSIALVNDIEEMDIQIEFDNFKYLLQTNEHNSELPISAESDTVADRLRQNSSTASAAEGLAERSATAQTLDSDNNVESVKQKLQTKADIKRFTNSPSNSIEAEDFLDDLDNLWYYEEKIPHKSLPIVRYVSDLADNKRLRDKKKWRQVKARIQLKTKYCRSLSNSVHGQTFYIHHRVMKLMPMKITVTRYEAGISLKEIDKRKGIKNENISILRKRESERGGRYHDDGFALLPVQPVFAIDAYNADGDLPEELVNILITLQHRDLSPEDYDLLLRLDDRVQPKTVDAAMLSSLKTDIVSEDNLTDQVGDELELCAICMEPYEIGHTRKFLPCNHFFHGTCIDNWLSNSSMNCPLDATPVFPEN